jgi:branched-subunit amino acid transport protein
VSTAAALSAVLTVGLVTYLARGGLILFLADRRLPAPFVRALRNVGPAVLAALTVTLVAGAEGRSGIGAEEIVGLAVAAVVAALTRNLIASLATGMVALWLALAVM